MNRSVIAPSGSPIRTVPMLPCMTTPGSMTSAPKLTKPDQQPPGPTTAASTSAVSPFCSDTTTASSASRGERSSSAAAAVCWVLTATSTTPSEPGRELRRARPRGRGR